MENEIKEKLSVVEAIKYCKDHFELKVADQTVRQWSREYGIGNKIVGRWMIDRQLLHDLLSKEYNEDK